MRLPPTYPWIKCNTDDAAYGSLGPASCDGMFRDYETNFLGCFAYNIGISYALNIKIMSIILAIELAHEKGWSYLWLTFM